MNKCCQNQTMTESTEGKSMPYSKAKTEVLSLTWVCVLVKLLALRYKGGCYSASQAERKSSQSGKPWMSFLFPQKLSMSENSDQCLRSLDGKKSMIHKYHTLPINFCTSFIQSEGSLFISTCYLL